MYTEAILLAKPLHHSDNFWTIYPSQCYFMSISDLGLDHVMCATAYVTAISLRINDVIGWASEAFYVERGSQRSQWRLVRKLS